MREKNILRENVEAIFFSVIAYKFKAEIFIRNLYLYLKVLKINIF